MSNSKVINIPTYCTVYDLSPNILAAMARKKVVRINAYMLVLLSRWDDIREITTSSLAHAGKDYKKQHQ